MNTTSKSQYFELSASACLNRLKAEIFSVENLADKVSLATAYGNLLSSNQFDIYEASDVEDHLIDCFQEFSSGSPNEDVSFMPDSEIVHVISTPLKSGGHTRLMERYQGCLGGDILVSRAMRDPKQVITGSQDFLIHSKPQGLSVEEIVNILVRYKIIILHIHPDDIVAAVAVGLARLHQDLRVVFVNHADHIFSFGYSISDACAEVSSFGFELSRQKRGVNSGFVGIPIDVASVSAIRCEDNTSDLQILAAGDRTKFRPGPGCDFPSFIETLFARNERLSIKVIGPDFRRDWWWWKVKCLYPQRVQISRKLPYDDYLSAFNSADVFVDSFPLTGATSLPEVRAKNIPVCGLVATAFGYTPLDLLKSENIECLQEELLGLFGKDCDLLRRNNDEGTRKLMAKFHDIQEVGMRLVELVHENRLQEPLLSYTGMNLTFYREAWSANRAVTMTTQFVQSVFAAKELSRMKRISIVLGVLKYSPKWGGAARILLNLRPLGRS